MLILALRPGERIWIGDHVTVTATEIASGVVKLGIDAPREVPVDRDKVRQSVRRHGRRKRLAG